MQTCLDYLRKSGVILLWSLAALAVRASGAQYYVDSNSGNDSHSGLSAGKAWRTLQKANGTLFKPGDELLLKRGSHWVGTLRPQGEGTPEKPIRLGAFGEGSRPFIDGGSGPAVLIRDQDGWIIKGLEVSNDKNSKQDALRVWGDEQRPHYRFIRVIDCVAHDAGASGIHVGGAAHGAYADIVVEDCVSYHNQDSGIFIQGDDHAEIRDSAVRRSLAYGNGWDGIKIYNGHRGVIEYSTAHHNGWKQDARVGIWCWNSEDITIQYCESYENVTPGAHDGGGFDIDWSCTRCVIQYCYSHDNDGAGYLFMGNGPGVTTQSMVRFNVSQNDGRKNDYGGILCFGTLRDSRVYSNVFYFQGSQAGAAIHFRGDKKAGYPSNVRVFNNIAIADQGRAVLRVATEAVDQNNAFDFNAYYSPSALGVIWGQQTYSDLERFRAATHQELHGFSKNPRLKAAGRAGPGRLPLDAYRLLPDSPCLGAGTEYTADYGTQDYWCKPLRGSKRMNVGVEQ